MTIETVNKFKVITGRKSPLNEIPQSNTNFTMLRSKYLAYTHNTDNQH